MPGHVIAIDQGTTSTRAIVFDQSCAPVAVAQQEFRQIYPAPGWVEHDPEDIWSTTVATVREVMAKAGLGSNEVAGVGIANQRETAVVWERSSGKPIHNAIVWQDRRTADRCAALAARNEETWVTEKTGLVLDPYFSATKIGWMLDHVEGARAQAQAGRLAFGTIDSFLLWRLTGGRAHATDATNAARTLLLDIHRGEWDEDLTRSFGVPRQLLGEVRDCAGNFGVTDPALFGGGIQVLGVAGDQQAATIGQACFEPGMMKATYGTGCFALLNTGGEAVRSRSGQLTTIAYQLEGRRTYALEGAIFVAGAAIQWLRDALGLLRTAAESEALARESDAAEPIYLVPAFVGLGAPWWDPDARGAIFGLSRNAGPAEFARAALEAVAYQTRDLMEAMEADWPLPKESVLRVDGGMIGNAFLLQFLADMLGVPVDRPVVAETTARGVAYLAGRTAGLYPDLAAFAAGWKLDRRFEPAMDAATRERKWVGWRDAVRRTLTRPANS
jgi:glycerol kinase